MRAYRQLYAAGRLLEHGIGYAAAQELADAARSGVDDAIAIPNATTAVQADELRSIRAQAIASGGTPDLPDAPRTVLGKIMRGRIEDFSGWALFNQDKTSEAIERLRLAVGIIPDVTPLWRDAAWHLGAALDQDGKREEALNYYIKSYTAGANDAVRRSTIEQLYRKINGSHCCKPLNCWLRRPASYIRHACDFAHFPSLSDYDPKWTFVVITRITCRSGLLPTLFALMPNQAGPS